MAGFGDTETCFQRHAVLPQGGMIIEAGCFTTADVTDLRLPTEMSKVIAVVCCASAKHGCISVADISDGYIVAKMNLTPVSAVINYIAAGY